MELFLSDPQDTLYQAHSSALVLSSGYPVSGNDSWKALYSFLIYEKKGMLLIFQDYLEVANK